ncbi:MAG: dioxygenase [Anaerolineae bacterium]|nr:dioxygenase [Anaerolineae bacterium]
MSHKNNAKKSLSRRRFIHLGTMGATGLLLAACADNPPADTATPAEAASQAQPTNTAIPPTATAQPSATAEPVAASTDTRAPAATATEAPTNTPTLSPTPQCDDHDETPAQTAGPFYTPDTPQRTSFLEAGITGTKLVVSGQVLTTDCRPIAGAILDFWHADDNGEYDNVGYRLRGHQFTDENGAYRLETIVPGLYPGRTRHIHVHVQGPNTDLLTTQLYFPNEPGNQSDGIFTSELIMDVQPATDGQAAVFDFVLV